METCEGRFVSNNFVKFFQKSVAVMRLLSAIVCGVSSVEGTLGSLAEHFIMRQCYMILEVAGHAQFGSVAIS